MSHSSGFFLVPKPLDAHLWRTMKKLIAFQLRRLGSVVLLMACFWAARSQAQGVAGSPTNGPAASGVIPKAAVLQGGWRPLLDEKLSSWELWMGVPRRTVVGLPEGTPTSATGHDGTPLGLNNDPRHVFSIRMEEGEPVLYITGEILGGLTTLETFSNYHLRAQIKWEPNQRDHTVTGILYHCTGPHGVFWKAWKRCFKFQVTEKDMGDLYALGGTCAEVRVLHPAKLWLYDPAGEPKKFAEGKLPGAVGANRAVHLPGDFEKPPGEWNTLELYTLGRTAVHVVNGHVALVVQNASTIEGPEHTETPLSAGQLQIQSEGGEACYRRVEIEPITELPAPIKQAAGL
jgi:hypothetical protein